MLRREESQRALTEFSRNSRRSFPQRIPVIQHYGEVTNEYTNNPLHTNASDIRTAIFKTMREYGMLFNIMFIDMTEEEITETCKHLVAIHEYYRALNRDECKLLCKINKINSTYHAAPTQYTDILQADVVICKDFDQNGLWVREYAILHGIPVRPMSDIAQVRNINDITKLFAKKTNTNMEKSKQ